MSYINSSAQQTEPATEGTDMTATYQFTTEAQSRAFWHHLLDQIGLDRLMSECSIKFSDGVYTITVRK